MTPPKPLFSEDAEQAVLSACLMDKNAIAVARAMLSPDSFYRIGHGRIFEAIGLVSDGGAIVDPLTLSNKLLEMGELEGAGGKDYVAFLIDAVPTAANIEYHGKIVREFEERRGLVKIAEELLESSRNLKVRPDAIAQHVSSQLLPVAAHTKTQGFRPISEAIVSVFEDIFHRRTTPGGMAGTSWGYSGIDAKTGGIRPGELAFLAGVPGSGKTALLLNIGRKAAEQGNRVAMISAEMGMNPVIERMLNARSGISTLKTRKGELDDVEWSYLVRVGTSVKQLPFTIDDTALPRIGEIMAKCRAEKAKHPHLSLVLLDFIQLIKDDDDDNRSLELTAISYALKGLAKELQVGIIVTCQVDAAAVEKTSDKRPQLHHLRWSQGMREAGDFIALVFREGQYNSHAANTIELNFRKARDVEEFKVNLIWRGSYMLVDDPSHPEMEGAAA